MARTAWPGLLVVAGLVVVVPAATAQTRETAAAERLVQDTEEPHGSHERAPKGHRQLQGRTAKTRVKRHDFGP